MTFEDLAIEAHFRFVFDNSDSWEYVKISENRIVCVHTPATCRYCTGKVYTIKEAITSEVIQFRK